MNIFLAKDGKPDGPYSVEQIREMVHAKQISMTDQVWEEGSSDWKRICDSTELAVKIVPALHQSHSQTPPPVPTCQLSATPAIASSNVRAQSQPEALPLHLETWGGLLGSTVNMGLDGELKNDTFTFKDKDTLLTRPLMGFGTPRTIQFPVSDVINVRQTNTTTLSMDLTKNGKVYRRRCVVNAMNDQNALILGRLLGLDLRDYKSNGSSSTQNGWRTFKVIIGLAVFGVGVIVP